jgi:Domain of unknown function (DUF4388)
MSEQSGGVEQGPFQAVEPPTGAVGLDTLPGPEPNGALVHDEPVALEAAFDPAPSASLVGSLSAFALADVLALLATASQTGELQVESPTVDGSLWLDGGLLSNAQVGSATTIGQAVFELACLTEGWFYFTAGATSSSGQPLVPVDGVLSEVRHQIDEWREMRSVVPLSSTVSLSPAPPGEDVQIRSDQWQVLTTVGTGGKSVQDVLEAIGGDQIVGLRTLRDLLAAGLIVLLPAPGADEPGTAAPAFAVIPSDPPVAVAQAPVEAGLGDDDPVLVPAPPVGEVPAGETDEQPGNLAEVAIMPPPIAEDPWTPVTQSAGTADNGVA